MSTSGGHFPPQIVQRSGCIRSSSSAPAAEFKVISLTMLIPG